MKCPFCNNKTEVYNSRRSHQATQTWRRRRCLTCNKSFTTREKVDFNGIVQVKNGDSREPYSRERLLLSIVRASDKLNLPLHMLLELTDSVELELKNHQFFEKNTQKVTMISEVTMTLLARYNRNLALQYLHNVYKNQPPIELVKQIVT